MDLKNITYEAFAKFSNEEIIEELEKIRWGSRVISPFDPGSKVYRCKHCQYHCKNTRKYFNVKSGTILENTKLPLFKWMYLLDQIVSKGTGVSSYKYARKVTSTHKTGWYNSHKIRIAMGQANLPNVKMTGIAEGDECHVGGKNGNRHYDKKYMNSQGRSNGDKTQVFGLVERNGQLRAYVVPDTSKESLQPWIHKIVDRDATALMTDDWKGYSGLNKFYNHMWVSNHHVDEDLNPHTNTIENCWLHLKRNFKGTYFKMERYHVQKYVDEMVFRYNTQDLTDGERLQELLKLIVIPVKYKDIRDPHRAKITLDLKALIN